MCGIIAYIGEKEALPILLNGLERLEYRGYDSAGIAILNENLEIIKTSGKIENLKRLIKAKKNKNLKGNIGIAHTRWATHGIPNELNAHPHFSCNKEIVIVHNGIIENYIALKQFLENKGHKFVSETDTEVLAHLIEEFYKENNFIDAIRLALNEVDGTYGIAVLCNKEKKIVAAKKGSPLIVGKADKGIFIASDVSAFLEHTRNVNYLEDGQIVVISENDYKISDLTNLEIKKKLEKIDWSLGQIEKLGHKHFMHKEIHEQPKTVHDAFRGRISEEIRLDGFDEIIKEDKEFVDKLNRIIIIGCGTSFYSAIYGKYIIEKLARIPVDVENAAEFRYRNPVLKDNDFVIAISQSGETADTKEAIEYVKRNSKSRTFGIVNVVGSSIARLVDSGIYIHAGPEIGVASTKAFTSQLTCLYLLALKFAYHNHKIEKEKLKEILTELKKIPDKIKEILKDEERIKEIAKKFKDSNHFLYMGRGINYPMALEGALKLKEIAYIPSDGLSAAEIKHGPIALIDDKMASIFIAPADSLFKKILINIEEIKSRGGKIIIITTKENEVRNVDEIIYVPRSSEDLMPILMTIPLQLFAYHVAVFKGCDVDKPRNLAKSVTVE